MPDKPPADPAVPGPGLVAEAFQGARFDKPTETRVLKAVNVSLKASGPPPGGAAVAPYSVRLTGVLTVPNDGAYRFALDGEANITVWLDDKVVFSRAGGTVQDAAVELTAGPHGLRADVSEIIMRDVSTRVRLLWAPPGGSLGAIPVGLFSHGANGAGPAGGGGVTVAVRPPATRPAGPGTKPTAPSAGPPAAVKLPAPTEDQLAAGRKAVRAKFAAYYADKKPVIQQALAAKLLAQVTADPVPGAVPPPAAETYALLREAADVAVAVGDVSTALSAVKLTGQRFKVDETELTLGVLTTAARTAKGPAAARAITESAVDVAGAALAAGNYDAAGKAAVLADQSARGVTDPAAGPRLKARAGELRDVLKEYNRLAPQFVKLRDDPGDEDANGKVGKFVCLMCDNWKGGLPLLGRSIEPELKVIADLERSAAARALAQPGAPVEPAALQRLADLWGGRLKTEREPYASRVKARAAYWYEQVFNAATDEAAREQAWDKMVAVRGMTDVLPLVDVKRDAIRGNWGWSGRDLVCEGRNTCLLQVPYRPKSSYDYVIEFTVTAGDITVQQVMPAGRGSYNWAMNGYGLQFDDYSTGGGSAPVKKLTGGLTPKVRHTSVIRVRPGTIRAYVDGKLAAEWAADAADVRGNTDYQLPDRACLGIGCMQTTIVVHSIRVAEAGGGI